MRYFGIFTNIHGQEVSVDIHTIGEADATPTPIGERGIYFSSEEAVMIESDVNDSFDTLLRTNCTVKLLTDRALTDFYTLSPQEAVIKVDVDGAPKFRGYVQPLAFSQPFVESLDEVSVEGIDPLSVMELFPYTTNWEVALANAQEPTLAAALTDVLTRASDGLGLSIDIDCPVLTSDGSMSALEALRISESLFLGEEEDDMWKLNEVAEEILQYLDLKAEVRGDSIKVYRTAPMERDDGITLNTVADTEATINIEESFNVISVTAERQSIDEIIAQPLDEDELTSDYTRGALYTQQYVVKGKDWTHGALWRWIHGGALSSGAMSDDNKYRIDTYIKPMNHPRWWFNDASDSITLVSQGSTSGMMGKANILGNTLASGIFRVGGVKPLSTAKDDEIPSKIDYKDMIIVGVGGRRMGYPTHENLISPNIMAAYTGSASGAALTPTDELTTNYIVISGKLKLVPWLPHISNGDLGEFDDPDTDWIIPDDDPNDNGYQSENFAKYMRWVDYVDSYGFLDDTPEIYHIVERWYNCEKATDRPILNSPQQEGLMPMISGVGKLFPYDKMTARDEVDNVRKVGVLRCQLRVGNKVLCEVARQEGEVGKYNSAYVWRDYKDPLECTPEEYLEQTFTIGYNPSLGDYLVGEEHDIVNTVAYYQNIEEEGLAIPINKSDALSGPVKFAILSPVDLHYCKRGVQYDATDNSQRVMPYVNHIELTDFEMKVVSDNGRLDEGDDDDIVYTSDTDENYINEKDDITMRINTALSSEERAKLGVSDAPSISVPFDISTQAPVLSVLDAGEVGKPEQFYVDRYWREVHVPRMQIAVNLEGLDWHIGDKLTHPALPGKEFKIISVGYDIQGGFATCNLKEQC